MVVTSWRVFTQGIQYQLNISSMDKPPAELTHSGLGRS